MEAETVALNFVLFEEGLPLLELFKILFKCDVKLKIREDNEATAKVVTAGYSKPLRYLRRTQKISLASLADEFNKPDVTLALVRSLDQKADVFTKAVANGLWSNAINLLGIASDYKVLSSTQTGLKMKREIGLNEALGQSARRPARSESGRPRRRNRSGCHYIASQTRSFALPCFALQYLFELCSVSLSIASYVGMWWRYAEIIEMYRFREGGRKHYSRNIACFV